MRRLFTGSLVLSVAVVPAALVMPAFSNPLAPPPHPVAIHRTQVRMGDFVAPATGVTRESVAPDAHTLAGDSLQRLANARGHVVRPGVLRETATSSAGNLAAVHLRKDSTAAFSAVGVTWQNDPAVGAVSLVVRAKHLDGSWGDWVTSDAPDAQGRSGVGRRGAEMLWTGPSAGVEVTVTPVTGAPPRDLRLDLIDPGSSNADRDPGAGRPPASADAAMAAPAIYTRAQWGADPRLMTWDPTYAPSVKAVVLHHTVNSNSYSAADVPAMLRSIYYYHSVSNGWGDIGYNVIVDRFGRLWEGRYGGLARALIGAHAGGFNVSTAGISMLGDFSTVDVPSVMRESISRYVAWKLSFGGVNPQGTTVLTGGPNTRYDHPVTLTLPTVFPHRTTSLTACPGEGGMRALPYIRARALQLMGSWASPSGIHARPVAFAPSTATWTFPTGSVKYGNPGDVPVVMDRNGDGLPDMTVFRQGTWYIGGAPGIGYGQHGDVPVPGYFNVGSGETLAVWRPSTATFYIYGRPGVTIGHPGDVPIVADYNGDGVDEIAVYQPSTATWSIAGRPPFVFGNPGDIAIPGDYNGDGHADAAVFDSNTATWTVSGQYTLRYGNPGDVPVPFRWNTDLVTDLVLWRPSTATWYARSIGSVQEGSPGQTPVVFG